MGTDEQDPPKVAKLARVVPETSHEREDLALVEAQAKASVASITAVGEQLKALAESPGVKLLLEGAGQALAKRWDYETTKLEKEHEQRMQADRLAAQTQARRDLLGMILVGGGLLAVTALAVTVVVLVAKGVITQGQAAVVAGIVGSLLAGLGFGRKMRGDSK